MTSTRSQTAHAARRIGLAGALGLAASLALVGCSSSGASSTATLPTVFPSSATTPSEAPASPDAPSSPAASAAPADPAEVQAYVDAMSPLAAEEQGLLDRYGSVTGANYTDDETTYNALVDLLPDVQAFILELESVPVPRGSAIAAAHADLVSGWNIQSEGMTLVAAAIKDQDLTAIAAGNSKLAEGRALLRQAQGEMNEALASS